MSTRRYRARTGAVRIAFLSKDGATYHKAWGDQHHPGAHMVMIIEDEDGAPADVYGCALDQFALDYRPVPGRPNTFRKVTRITARPAEEGERIESLEGWETAAAGDLLVTDARGNQWLMKPHRFEQTYEPA